MERLRVEHRKHATMTASRFREPRPVEPTVNSRAARLARRASGRSRALLVVIVIWALGLVALGLVLEFQQRLDAARQAQDLTTEMLIQQGDLLQIAFAPATTHVIDATQTQKTKAELQGAKTLLNRSTVRLAHVGQGDEPERIAALIPPYYALVDRLAALVATGKSGPAALLLGNSGLPGGIEGKLIAELQNAHVGFDVQATQAKTVASLVTLSAIGLLLTAFSIAFHHLMRARRRSHHDATTDALTGLGNRRKLFADMAQATASLRGKRTIAVGIFDLDGFKAYNDTFGHPAGDALLARLGERFATAVGTKGNAYRIGGDEFVASTEAADHEQVMSVARAALSEDGPGFSIGCSIGTASVHAGETLEAALYVADQRLYSFKHSAHAERRSGAKDVLLQVLAEQNEDLVTHLGHVAALAASTATALHLTPDLIELTRLAAELHDIGKAAIPDSILDKPGPLTPSERAFMERHSAIGERIVAAAPALEAIAPIIRAAHERPDGKGYPDGLRAEQIPICARVIAVVDAYDAMTTNRPYRHAISRKHALTELHSHGGTQFDQDVVDAFAKVVTSAALAPAEPTAAMHTSLSPT
jgi:diguanylate cyclase (GGDEF)-like protein